MEIMTAREWFEKAEKENFAIGAFNVDNLDIFKAVCEAAKKKSSPVMLEFSQGEVGYFGLGNIVDLVLNAKREYGIPILLNLDHAKSVEDCLAAINMSGGTSASFDDVHFDGSGLPFEENVELSKKVVVAAHAKNLLVEGEIDKLPGSSEVHTDEISIEEIKKSFTDPIRAKKFVDETGVDIFAAVFGNVHGTFPNQPDLDFELLKLIREALPNTFLSMHGGSGIPADQVQEAIKIGRIVKINVNTEIRQAFRDALIEELGESPDQSAYYKLTPDITRAVMAVVEGKIDVFGSYGKF
ncbi:hypothetical protein A2870_01455 [Candidatus Curtissbacteria bacterium RIFCSPHIGHO2_01_FULL_41_11]|uniref:Tagatose-bisphosphate aldolase n=1 Tax=Candidatus Curtissbacteria bacterium RIFCSPHIGHO2_01_FULL_41_11 TaxID=1797711 RepID=A0A1F5G684_9BACT|nr:MAG: hypothetical protein A2870_01455 [Candidatus Curtissbacteria bacterium RIFCSPHIGHO2_01_FULL_41_11]